MIDTIKLELQQSMYAVIDHNKFTPSTYDMFNTGPYSTGPTKFSKQNPTKKDKKAGIYKPRLSIARRPLKTLGYQNTLYVEISLPKLVFGNNFDELTNQDFKLVKSKLVEVLRTMGVLAYESQLSEAKVSSIHYGKNIILDDYTTPYTYIRELRQVDMSKIYDANQTDYRNGGLSYKYHTNTFEFTFYDKIKDLERSKLSEKRAIDKDDYCQLSLLDLIEDQNKKDNPFQVLRLEMRLNTRRKIRQHLKSLKLKDLVTFEYLFDNDLAQLSLLSFYDKIFKKYVPTIEINSTLEAFESIKTTNPRLRDGKILELVSSQDIINKVGVREFRNIVNDTTWYRLKRDLKRLKGTKPSMHLNNLRNKLSNFEQVRLVDYPQLMLNNDKDEIS